jgi:hypothetical protein
MRTSPGPPERPTHDILETRMLLRIVVPLVAVLMSGCANYKALSAFGGETTKMTTVVKNEFEQVDTLCLRQAELAIVVGNIANDGPIEQCARTHRAQGQYAALTVEVLDGYADALGALADDKPFDLSPDLKSVGGKARALKDGAGNALVTAKEADALASVASLLVDTLASAKRDEAVQQLIAATPDLTTIGQSLRSYFMLPPGAQKAPYANLVSVISSSASSVQTILESGPMRRAEPIRTAELLRELRTRQRLLARRAPDAANSVPAHVVTAIDAWLAALEKFSTDALKPDSKELIERLKALSVTTRLARDAVAER